MYMPAPGRVLFTSFCPALPSSGPDEVALYTNSLSHADSGRDKWGQH